MVEREISNLSARVRFPFPAQMKVKQIIGWYGVTAIVVAFALLNFNIVDTNNLAYQLLNVTGSISIIVEASSKKDYQPVVLNIVWLLLATYGLWKILF